ncbi:hypothetical protein [Metabacillus sediminilitoris]|uniref:Uncharacterized protein n=1 Tax=Metabacillus sediminilitoris TaxID=2567941 RepID=A0A4S4C160_9BACI|nr:hypothetical protein [Metabacillus sediminilitoris]QGQ48282.1 hypothetical protein GMB29_25260 [Metabacillus sediminilitoris]THF81360.1 hypothetical protein E6W99_05460 [Metabacillus sediminilitoris]
MQSIKQKYLFVDKLYRYRIMYRQTCRNIFKGTKGMANWITPEEIARKENKRKTYYLLTSDSSNHHTGTSNDNNEWIIK